MQPLATVPFRCEICDRRFYVEGGGRCPDCGKIVCHGHLRKTLTREAVRCTECEARRDGRER